MSNMEVKQLCRQNYKLLNQFVGGSNYNRIKQSTLVAGLESGGINARHYMYDNASKNDLAKSHPENNAMELLWALIYIMLHF